MTISFLLVILFEIQYYTVTFEIKTQQKGQTKIKKNKSSIYYSSKLKFNNFLYYENF